MRLVMVLLVLALLPGCLVKVDDDGEKGDEGPDDQAASGAQLHDIAMRDRKYDPSSITVARNDTLRFLAQDGPHSVQSTNGVYDQGDVQEGSAVDMLVDLAGTYTIQCRFHPDMRLSLTVTA